MPSLSTLVDNFNDGVIGPDWGDSYGGANETGGQARVPCVAGGFASYQTGASWSFAGATVFLKLAAVPAASGGSDVSCNMHVTSPTAGASIGFHYNAVTGMLRIESNIGFWDDNAIEIAYSSTTHRWLRLREDAGTVYWDTSPDGTTWTNRRTATTPAWVVDAAEQCRLDLWAHRDTGTTDYAAYDNVNTLADGAVWTGTADLTATTALTAAPAVSAHAVSDLAADSTLAAAPTLSARAAADLTAEAALVADAASSPIPEVAAMSAGEQHLLIEQGSTFMQTYTVVEPTDWTWDGWTARAQIRSAPADSGELLLDLTPYLTVLGPAVRLAIPAAQTQMLTRNGVWDLEMVTGTTVVRILQGRVTTSLEVTR
ncbi:hypothetical protein [Streptomyces reticuli]|uniref:hypothetical protein n=1 Tax=Streptomyces reticuli TaxID=1926 RepID=UPI00073DC132|nr:hypothetical protein [Streptomyces sp. SID7810]CUW31771.1 hypothetical protein TUE45_06520 [Streptomyces reticuli]